MMILFCITMAIAGEFQAYPRMAVVDLPEKGVTRIRIPLTLSQESDLEGSDLLLVNGAGNAVPFGVVADAGGERIYSTGNELNGRFLWSPTAQSNQYAIEIENAAADGLQIQWAGPTAVATVTVRSSSGIVGGPILVWSQYGNQQSDIPLKPFIGKATVDIQWHQGDGSSISNWSIWQDPSPNISPDQITLPIEAVILQEIPWVSYRIRLPGPLTMTHAILHVSEDVFDRRVAIQPLDTTLGDIPYEPYPTNPISRVKIGEWNLDNTSIYQTVAATDILEVLISTEGRDPLDLQSVMLDIPGRELVVRDPGPGPFTLYGGAAIGTTVASDLQGGAALLWQSATQLIKTNEVLENPEYLAPDLNEALVGPSTTIPLTWFSWERPISGQGLVRISMDEHVISHAKPDFSDLRLVTASDQQIPYLIQENGIPTIQKNVPFSREETGAFSRIILALGESNRTLKQVVVHSSAETFSRQTSLNDISTLSTIPLRSVYWVREKNKLPLTLSVERRVGNSLELQISAGDNLPLSIDSIDLIWSTADILAVLPPTPVRLVYGNPRAKKPEYDMYLVQDQLRRRAATVATMSEPALRKRQVLNWWDKGFLAVGIGILSVTLLGILVSLLRKVPPAPIVPNEPETNKEAVENQDPIA